MYYCTANMLLYTWCVHIVDASLQTFHAARGRLAILQHHTLHYYNYEHHVEALTGSDESSCYPSGNAQLLLQY